MSWLHFNSFCAALPNHRLPCGLHFNPKLEKGINDTTSISRWWYNPTWDVKSAWRRGYKTVKKKKENEEMSGWITLSLAASVCPWTLTKIKHWNNNEGKMVRRHLPRKFNSSKTDPQMCFHSHLNGGEDGRRIKRGWPRIPDLTSLLE